MEAITPIKVNRNRNYLVVDCWLSWSRLDYRHHYDRRRQFPGQGGYAVAVNRKGRYSMLDEKDLQAIAEMMKGMESRIDQKLEKQKQEILDESTRRMKLLLDSEVTTRFNLLAEGQQTILEKLERLDDIEVMDTRVTALEAMVKKLNREMEKLKKAQ